MIIVPPKLRIIVPPKHRIARLLLALLPLVFFTAVTPTATQEDRIELKARPLPARHDECRLCHTKKQLEFTPARRRPVREHEGHELRHGRVEVSCNSCHDAQNSNLLLSTQKYPSNWKNSSPACERCHAEQYRDWVEGLHGKMSGQWKGKKIRNHCIDCHEPHSVSIKPMTPLPPPARPRLGVDKGKTTEH